MRSSLSLVSVAIFAVAMLEGAKASVLGSQADSAASINSNMIYKRQSDWFASSNEPKHNSFQKRQEQQQQQVPPFLINIIINRLSADLADTIAKYSKVKEAGKKMPTTSELTAALKIAMKKGGNDPVAHAQATKAAIDGLAEAKLSGSNSTGSDAPASDSPASESPASNSTSKLSARQELPMGGDPAPTDSNSASGAPKFKSSDVRRFANKFLKMVTAFADAKAAGGSLPTAEEIAQVLHHLQQTLDPTDKRKSAHATHAAFMELAASKYPEGKKPKPETKTSGEKTDSKKSDAETTKPADSDPSTKKPEVKTTPEKTSNETAKPDSADNQTESQ
ncbi:hypothetical protein DFH28DRAFT_1104110 [Melampsora americana]|nr:hypothetical protein DFH28DRAFT_1104110 [Melampsora americana]